MSTLRLLLSCLPLAALLLAGGCLSSHRAVVEHALTAIHEPETGLVVRTSNGSVQVAVDATRTDVAVTARLTAGGDTEVEAQERARASRVVLERLADRSLIVTAEFPDGRRNGDGCSFDVIVPHAAGVQIETLNGEVELSGTTGAADVGTSNGGVTVRDHAGSLQVHTSNGSVRLERIGGPIDVRTSNGAVRLVAAEDLHEPFELATSNGTIEVRLPGRPNGEVAASTSNGRVEVEARDVEVLRLGSARDCTLRFGGGGPASAARSSNGGIRFVFD